jgi:NucS shadow ORF
MSLAVFPELLDQARYGDIDDAAFIACIQASLPYAWQLVNGLTRSCARPVPTSPTIRCRRPTRPGEVSYCG